MNKKRRDISITYFLSTQSQKYYRQNEGSQQKTHYDPSSYLLIFLQTLTFPVFLILPLPLLNSFSQPTLLSNFHESLTFFCYSLAIS